MGLVRRRLWGTIVWLLGAGAALGAVLWQLQSLEQRGAADKAAKRVSTFASVDDLVEVRLTSSRGEFVISRPAPGQTPRPWQLSAPLATSADEDILGGLVRALVEFERDSKVEAPAGGMLDLASFGLDPPRFAVELRTADGRHERLRVGKKNTFNGNLYAQREGTAEVLLVGGALEYQVDKSLYDLRDKRVAGFSESEVEQLAVNVSGGGTYVLQKHGDGWQLGAAPADRDKATNLVRTLVSARAIEFIAEAGVDDAVTLGTAALLTPALGVDVTLSGGRVVSVALGARKEGDHDRVYARSDQGPIGRLSDADLLRRLREGATSLRDRHLLRFERNDVTAIELRGPEQGVRLEKSRDAGAGKDAWRLVQPEAAPAAHYKVAGLLFRIGDLEAESPDGSPATDVERQAKGLDAGSRIVLAGARGKLGELSLGKIDGGRQWVERVSDGLIFQVSQERVAEIRFEAAAYRDEPAQAAAVPVVEE